jgi:hypothetical protein
VVTIFTSSCVVTHGQPPFVTIKNSVSVVPTQLITIFYVGHELHHHEECDDVALIGQSGVGEVE